MANKRRHRTRVRRLVRGHLNYFTSKGLVYDVTFVGSKLGFSVSVQRYGKHGTEAAPFFVTEPGRNFVAVDEVREGEANGRVFKTDELLAVNGMLVRLL